MRKLSLFAVMLSSLLVAPAFAADWGDLKLKFVQVGTPKTPAKINVNKDQAFCGKHGLTDESLVVGKDGAVANVIVYLYQGRGAKSAKVHPDYAKTEKGTVNLDNKNCRYEPHVALLRTSQKLEIGNPDPVGHNSKVDTFKNPAINPIIPAKGKTVEQFKAAERLPAKVSCSIHSWMNAWLVIQDHPYMAVSGKDGVVTIKDLPAGKWDFQVWHEKAGYIQEVKIGGKSAKWKRGRPSFTIKKGVNDLGKVELSAKIFEK